MTTASLHPENNEVAREQLIARGWAALPASYRIPDIRLRSAEARAWCKHFAESHYENFHVASWFLARSVSPALPRDLRLLPHLRRSWAMRSATRHSPWLFSTSGAANSMPATKAARVTPYLSHLPKRSAPVPFRKNPSPICLPPFARIKSLRATQTMQDVLGYCRYSANPVGRLVLYACGYSDEERFRLSDATCSALQLANFWQDVRVDFAKDRVYLPQNDMQRFGVSDATIARDIADAPNSGLCCVTKSNLRAGCSKKACR